MEDVMPWKIVFATGAFGGVAPILLQLAIDLTQGRKQVEAIGLSILIGMAIYAVLGGGLSLIWKETDLKKVFYIGLGLPSLLMIASANISTPPQPTAPITPARTMSGGQVSPPPISPAPPGAENLAPEMFAPMGWSVFAQINVADRQLIVDLDSATVPPEVLQSPLYLVFEPNGIYANVQYGKAIVTVPPTATSFHIQGSTAASDPLDLPSNAGATTRVLFGAEKRSWYGLLYSLGIKEAPYQLIKKSMDSVVPVTDPKDSIVSQFQLSATSKAEQGGNRYNFTLAIQVPSSLKENIASVDYDLVYEPNPLVLIGTDPNTNFQANYEGWGCYRNVEVTLVFKNSAMPPRNKLFNMCSVLGW
jgi:hypothetical protein